MFSLPQLNYIAIQYADRNGTPREFLSYLNSICEVLNRIAKACCGRRSYVEPAGSHFKGTQAPGSDGDFVVHNELVLTREMKKEFGRLVVRELGGEAVNLHRSIECTYTTRTGIELSFDIVFTSTTWGSEVTDMPDKPFRNRISCRRVVRLLKLLGHHRHHSLRQLSGIKYEWIVLTVWSRMPPVDFNIEVIKLFGATLRYLAMVGSAAQLAADVNACPDVRKELSGPFLSDGVLQSWANHAVNVIDQLGNRIVNDENDFRELLAGRALGRRAVPLGL
ncbi:hypothetical protein HDV00_009608 [Rhizophlyctis rosea]|nr:hypothetical protein HDV00_009608 [Rhizophlyctis rosea]